MSADLFSPFLETVPDLIRHIEKPADSSLTVSASHVVFSSLSNEVYSVIARPTRSGKHPGILLLHGGKGSAEVARALEWARLGYVVVAPDLPGIAEPTGAPNSSGAWKQLPYGEGRWQATPDATVSTIFQGVVAALHAFNLLASQPDVDASRIGVHGISWGGYATTMVCALMKQRVHAGFSLYGCGFYEETTFSKSLETMPPAERARWYASLDAGRFSSNIAAPFFIATASNDTFFWPPAVEKTLATIPSPTGRLYAPNADHTLPVPGGQPDGQWAEMASIFFDFHLKSQGSPLPQIEWLAPDHYSRSVSFKIHAPLPLIGVHVYFSASNSDWPQREWRGTGASASGGDSFIARIPDEFSSGDHCFVLITDERSVSISSPMHQLHLQQDSANS